MAEREKCFWFSHVGTLVVVIFLSTSQCFAASAGGWRVGAGFVLSGFPGIVLNAAWHGHERLSVVGEVTIGLDTCAEPTPVVWLRSGISYELPVTNRIGAQLNLGMSQILVAVSGQKAPAATLLEVGLGASGRMTERLDLLGELRLAHFMGEDPGALIMPVGMQLGLSYRL